MKKYYPLIVLIVLLIAFFIGLFVVTSTQQLETNNPSTLLSLKDNSEVTAKINNSILKLEVARTFQKREEGLMNTPSLPEDSGMIFIFDDEQPRRFWMKDTQLSLDIIFFDKNMKIVKIFENTKPEQTEETYSSDFSAQLVVETNSGWTRKHNLKVHDTLEILSVK